jgi:hypothetical protein
MMRKANLVAMYEKQAVNYADCYCSKDDPDHSCGSCYALEILDYKFDFDWPNPDVLLVYDDGSFIVFRDGEDGYFGAGDDLLYVFFKFADGYTKKDIWMHSEWAWRELHSRKLISMEETK